MSDVLVVEGDLDLPAAGRLRGQLADLIHRGSGDVIVDLTAVEFIDSTGLATLLNALRRLTRANRRLILVAGPESPVRRILALSRLDTTFTVVADREAA